MPWQDRLREAALTSPSGVRRTFTYESVSKTVEKHATGFNFPDAQGTFVQDLGNSGRKVPLRAIFWGDDYDIEAEEFEAGLLERGVHILEHPLYGVINVVPFGSIGRNDDLAGQANQTTVAVTLWETNLLAYPLAESDPESDALDAVDASEAAVAEEFATDLAAETIEEQTIAIGRYQALLKTVTDAMDAVTAIQEEVAAAMKLVEDSINGAIDVLIKGPLDMALQTIELIKTPARIFESLGARLSAYRGLLGQITGGGSPATRSALSISKLYAAIYVASSVRTLVNTEYTLKQDALDAADAILVMMDDLTVWEEAAYLSLGINDPNGSYLKLREATSVIAGHLIQVSFQLRQERTLELTRPRNIIELCAELYGDVDESLDLLIRSNDLSGSEILELPPGRKVVYYA